MIQLVFDPMDEETNWQDVLAQEPKVRDVFMKIAVETMLEYSFYFDECESPIEKILALWIHRLKGRYERLYGLDILFMPQDKIEINSKSFRADFTFAVQTPTKKFYKFIVECDGHEFHEKTKEQAQRDKSRDRIFQANGFTVLRFTGSEIYQDAEKCANEIYQTIVSVTGKEG